MIEPGTVVLVQNDKDDEFSGTVLDVTDYDDEVYRIRLDDGRTFTFHVSDIIWVKS